MQTIVFFHAHPDDECIVTGGTIARAADEGNRVVLVVATNGDHGDVPEDLAHDETLIDRRRRETEQSASVLGVKHVLWLGYADSGMTGWDQNEHPESFWRADIEDAASRLAKILVAEQADALVVYDWHGVYGHPDHVQVHRVGTRAAEVAGTPRVLEATMNRTQMIEYAEKLGMDDFDPEGPADDGNPFGTLEEELHWGVDVNGYLGRKRARAGVPRQPGQRRRRDAQDARRHLRDRVRYGVVPRARPRRRPAARLAVRRVAAISCSRWCCRSSGRRGTSRRAPS